MAIRKREVVALGLQRQICEKELALQRQRDDEKQLAQAEKNLVERFAENQQKEMRETLVIIKYLKKSAAIEMVNKK